MINEWEVKVWGKTRCMVESPLYSRHELRVNAGSFCSFHYHNERANRFTVDSGKIRIVWSYAWRIHRQVLTAGNTFDIPSLVPHQFQVLEDGQFIEEYWADRGGEVRNSDIIRLTKGGKSENVHSGIGGILREDGKFWEIPD